LAKARRIKREKAAASGVAASHDTLENYNRFKSYGDAAAKPPQYAKDSNVHKRMPDSEYLDNSQMKLQKIRKGTIDKPENMVRGGWKAKMAAKGTAKAGRVRKASGVLGGAAVAAGATDA
jgi:nitrogen fixation protein FixH